MSCHSSSSLLSQLEPDIDALTPSLYAERPPLSARPRTTLLRVPWAAARVPTPKPKKEGAASPPAKRDEELERRSLELPEGGQREPEDSEDDLDEWEDEGEEWRLEESKEGWRDFRFSWRDRDPHHRVTKNKAPYPEAYTEDLLDHYTAHCEIGCRIKGSVSYHVFESGKQPKMCLDLGCGTGEWILAAADEWPDCKFVGFDLAPVQPEISHRPDLVKRVTWMQGNFTRTRLPFESSYFDHVHVLCIARGMPENEWMRLFEEITRVMKPGGTLELIEEDIIFPILTKFPSSRSPSVTTSVDVLSPPSLSASSSVTPSSASEPATSEEGGTISANSSARIRPASIKVKMPHVASTSDLMGLPEEHDHSLLEKLFYQVFERRRINCEPTSYLPFVLETYLNKVMMAPPLVFPAQAFEQPAGAPRLPRYNAETLSSHSSELHELSTQQYLPNEEFRAEPVMTAQFLCGPMAYRGVLAVKEAMWLEYLRLREKERMQGEAWARERLEIKLRREQRAEEAREGWTPASDLAVSVDENASVLQFDLREHHTKLVALEEARDAARIAELDQLEKAVLEREEKMRKRRRGSEADQIAVDRIQLGGGFDSRGEEKWTDVTVVATDEDKELRHERRRFDMLVERYERDMRFRTRHAQTLATYLRREEPPTTPPTPEEAEWQRGFRELMARGDDSEVIWRKIRVYCATKGWRRLGTGRAAT